MKLLMLMIPLRNALCINSFGNKKSLSGPEGSLQGNIILSYICFSFTLTSAFRQTTVTIGLLIAFLARLVRAMRVLDAISKPLYAKMACFVSSDILLY